MLHNSLLLFTVSQCSFLLSLSCLEALPSIPSSLKLNSLIQQKGQSLFCLSVLPAVAAAAACHHTATFQTEPGILIIKT